MHQEPLHYRSVLLGVLLLVAVGVAPAFTQQTSEAAPRVVLTRLSTPSGDTVAQKLADTITASIDLVMRMTGSLRVERADFLVPTAAFDRALEYYRQVGADGAVYGEVKPSAEGGYSVDLEVWNAAKSGSKPAALRRNISDMLASFDLADELSLEVASTVVGRQLSEGSLVVENVADLPHFAVYADGHLLGRDRTSFRVLTGPREIVVAKPGLVGDEPVQVFRVTVAKDETATVSLTAKTPPEPAKPEPPPTGVANIRVQSAGTLFVDGVERSALAAGQMVEVTGLALGGHRFEMHYADGHVENAEATFSASSLSTYISLSYVPIPPAPEKPPQAPVRERPAPAPAPQPKVGFGFLSFSYAPFASDSAGNTIPSYALTVAGYGERGGYFGMEFRGYSAPSTTSTSTYTTSGSGEPEPSMDFLGITGFGGRLSNSIYADLGLLYGLVSNATDGEIYFAIGGMLGMSIRLGAIVLRMDIPLWTAPGATSPTTGNSLEYYGVDFAVGLAF